MLLDLWRVLAECIVDTCWPDSMQVDMDLLLPCAAAVNSFELVAAGFGRPKSRFDGLHSGPSDSHGAGYSN